MLDEVVGFASRLVALAFGKISVKVRLSLKALFVDNVSLVVCASFLHSILNRVICFQCLGFVSGFLHSCIISWRATSF